MWKAFTLGHVCGRLRCPHRWSGRSSLLAARFLWGATVSVSLYVSAAKPASRVSPSHFPISQRARRGCRAHDGRPRCAVPRLRRHGRQRAHELDGGVRRWCVPHGARAYVRALVVGLCELIVPHSFEFECLCCCSHWVLDDTCDVGGSATAVHRCGAAYDYCACVRLLRCSARAIAQQ